MGRLNTDVLLATLRAFVATAASANPRLKDAGAGERISNATIAHQPSGPAPGTQASAFSDLHLEWGGKVTLVADSSFQHDGVNGMRGSVFDTVWMGARIALRRWDNSVPPSRAWAEYPVSVKAPCPMPLWR
jgi:hypothetical protein